MSLVCLGVSWVFLPYFFRQAFVSFLPAGAKGAAVPFLDFCAFERYFAFFVFELPFLSCGSFQSDPPPTEDYYIPTEDGKQADTDDSGTLYVDMVEVDIEYSIVELYTDPDDLEISAELWNDGEEEMVTLVVNNRAHIPPGSRRSNVVIIEAYPQWEETPVFRYSLPEEFSDKATWSMDGTEEPSPCPTLLRPCSEFDIISMTAAEQIGGGEGDGRKGYHAEDP